MRDTYLDGAPDLAVEIVSPGTAVRDREEKPAEYGTASVPEFWLVDPGRREAVFWRLRGDGRYRPVPVGANDIYRSRAVPGFRLCPDWLWLDPPPSALRALIELGIRL